MLTKRIFTALIGVPIILIVLYAGRAAVLALVLVIGAAAVLEAYRLLDKVLTPAAAAVLGFLYIAAPFAFLMLLYDLNHGPVLLVVTLLATWIADTSAYAIGKSLGRRPLAPSVSPNKTAEGAAGSIIVSALALASFVFVPALSALGRFLFGAVLSIAALAGDLFESWLKRRAGVKDSGAILPGHGGLLDRIDSLLFTAPASYLLLKIWI